MLAATIGSAPPFSGQESLKCGPRRPLEARSPKLPADRRKTRWRKSVIRDWKRTSLGRGPASGTMVSTGHLHSEAFRTHSRKCIMTDKLNIVLVHGAFADGS